MTAVLLFAPPTIRFAPLFGQPPAVVERTLGKPTRRFKSTLGGIPTLETTSAKASVVYLNGKALRFGRDFSTTTKLTPEEALTACGYDPRHVLISPDTPLDFSGVTTQNWTMNHGALPEDYRAVFTRRWTDKKIEGQSFWVDAPRPVALAPSANERTAILDAIRPAFTKAFQGQKLKFIVSEISTYNGWAFAMVDPVAVSGERLNLARSNFAGQEERASASRFSHVLVHRIGGAWKMVECAFYDPHDAWKDWPGAHQLPKAMFPYFKVESF